ncbi:hypothetical protein C8F04DRAFT_1271811 [Mycena alexandri]|uniref:Zn(2)-C6 fungal-type domain-containing protein n=1 Tax=Mycena alexandri TaxID=1745969 RepID=A0AAD6WTM7_9AGAR|nr:hypothetical protein C8F04DRAFT_1271811 [Mycena alexandri]
MSTIPPSKPAASQSSQRKRIYLACVNCRRRKVRCITTGDSPDTPCQRCVKHGLICDYVPVSLEREKSLFDIPPGEGSNSTHSPTMPPSWSQAPPHNGTYGRSNYAPPSVPHFNPGYGQPGAPSQFNSVPGYLPGRSHPVPPPAAPFPNPATPHFLSPATNPYTRGTNPFPQSTQLVILISEPPLQRIQRNTADVCVPRPGPVIAVYDRIDAATGTWLREHMDS